MLDFNNMTKLKTSKGQTPGCYCKLNFKEKEIYVKNTKTNSVIILKIKQGKNDKYIISSEQFGKKDFYPDGTAYAVYFDPMIIVKAGTGKKFIYFIAPEFYDFYE